MNFSLCPRCEAQEFETRFSVCMNCNYGLDSDSGGEIPIPAWVLKYVAMTPAELAEIREINFGFRPSPGSKQGNTHEESISTQVPDERKLIPLPSKKRWHQRTFETLETGQCVM